MGAPAAYFYNVNVTSAVHGADPTAGTTVQSVQQHTVVLCSSLFFFFICNMITLIFTGAQMYSSYLFFFILIRLM